MRTAKINNQGVVEQVIVGTSEWANSRLGGTWIDTETKVGIGWTYSQEFGFRPPQPYQSWSWVEGAWTPPVPYPDVDLDGATGYEWSDESEDWVVMSNKLALINNQDEVEDAEYQQLRSDAKRLADEYLALRVDNVDE